MAMTSSECLILCCNNNNNKRDVQITTFNNVIQKIKQLQSLRFTRFVNMNLLSVQVWGCFSLTVVIIILWDTLCVSIGRGLQWQANAPVRWPGGAGVPPRGSVVWAEASCGTVGAFCGAPGPREGRNGPQQRKTGQKYKLQQLLLHQQRRCRTTFTPGTSSSPKWRGTRTGQPGWVRGRRGVSGSPRPKRGRPGLPNTPPASLDMLHPHCTVHQQKHRPCAPAEKLNIFSRRAEHV